MFEFRIRIFSKAEKYFKTNQTSKNVMRTMSMNDRDKLLL